MDIEKMLEFMKPTSRYSALKDYLMDKLAPLANTDPHFMELLSEWTYRDFFPLTEEFTNPEKLGIFINK